MPCTVIGREGPVNLCRFLDMNSMMAVEIRGKVTPLELYSILEQIVFVYAFDHLPFSYKLFSESYSLIGNDLATRKNDTSL